EDHPVGAEACQRDRAEVRRRGRAANPSRVDGEGGERDHGLVPVLRDGATRTPVGTGPGRARPVASEPPRHRRTTPERRGGPSTSVPAGCPEGISFYAGALPCSGSHRAGTKAEIKVGSPARRSAR